MHIRSEAGSGEHLARQSVENRAPSRPGVEFPPTNDEKYLGLIAKAHYILSGLFIVISLMCAVNLAIGVQMIAGQPGGTAPAVMGKVFVGLGGVGFLFGSAMSVLTVIAGRSIASRKRHLFCLIVAGLLCLGPPFGTILGGATFLVLTKSHVRRSFGAGN